VIEIHAAGGFPSLVLDSKKEIRHDLRPAIRILEAFRSRDRPTLSVFLLKTKPDDPATTINALLPDRGRPKTNRANFEEAPAAGIEGF